MLSEHKFFWFLRVKRVYRDELDKKRQTRRDEMEARKIREKEIELKQLEEKRKALELERYSRECENGATHSCTFEHVFCIIVFHTSLSKQFNLCLGI